VDPERIQNEAMNVLLAGRDTTASALSALWFELARRPDVWTKLQREVDSLDGRLPSSADVKTMTYLKNCIRKFMEVSGPKSAAVD
jgi:cytochrome P450